MRAVFSAWTRVLVPSWRFFDTAGSPLRLEYRWREEGGSVGEWSVALALPKRGFTSFFFNPQGNLHLASFTIVERFVSELQEENAKDSFPVTHDLVRNIVWRELRNRTSSAEVAQFRVSAGSSRPEGKWDEVYTSEWLTGS